MGKVHHKRQLVMSSSVPGQQKALPKDKLFKDKHTKRKQMKKEEEEEITTVTVRWCAARLYLSQC